MTKFELTSPKFSVGITGHRDCARQLADLLGMAVNTQLQDIEDRLTPLPVEIICGLAEGADILVAQQALALGMSVHAVLPMPIELYKDDFSSEGLDLLEELIAHPNVRVNELPISDETNLLRDEQYLLLKDYIVRRSNLLLALWDGEVTGLPGGTSDVILEYLAEDCTVEYRTSETTLSRTDRLATDDDDGNLVISIHAPRQWTPEADELVQMSYLMSEGAPYALASLLDFPHKVAERWAGLKEYFDDRQSNYASDIQSWDMIQDGDEKQDAVLADINAEFVRADQLAMANQKFSDALFRGFGVAAGAMGLAFLAYAKLAAISTLLIVYLCLFAAGYILFKLSTSRGWFRKHLAYRAMAETLRIRYYLVLSGLSGFVDSGRLIKATRVHRFNGIEWLRDAIRWSEPLIAVQEFPDGVDAVRERWIDDQSVYFSKKSHQLHKEHKNLEKVKGILFFSSFIGIVALLLFKKDLYHIHLLGTDAKTLLVFFMGLLPLWLALWELFQSKMAVRELGWQYANQQRIFAEARRRMSSHLGENSNKSIVLGLAESSLSEIFQWTAQRFHREHEPPAAG